MQVHRIPDLGMLMLRKDLSGVGDLAPEQVLQRLIAVETAAPLPDLSDPRPDRVRRCTDVDAECVGPLRVRNESVAGKGIGRLALLCALAQALPSDERGGNEIPGDQAGALESSRNPDAGGMCAMGHGSSWIPQFSTTGRGEPFSFEHWDDDRARDGGPRGSLQDLGDRPRSEEQQMAYSITCRDAGTDCPATFTTEDRDELMEHAKVHVQGAHPEITLDDAAVQEFEGLIRES